MKKIRAILIGDNQLTLDCIEVFFSFGHDLVGVVTQNDRLQSWCCDKRINYYTNIDEVKKLETLLDAVFCINVNSTKMLSYYNNELVYYYHAAFSPFVEALFAQSIALIHQKLTYSTIWYQLQTLTKANIIVEEIIDIQNGTTAQLLAEDCSAHAVDGFIEIVKALSYETHVPLRTVLIDDDDVVQLNQLIKQEKQKLLIDWNQTEKDYLLDKTISQVFEEQVAKAPNNIAVVFGDKQFTYGELNRKANQLARYIVSQHRQLTNQALQPDTLIALCVDRSLEMIIGILGVLKAGGAYLLIDPAQPHERIRFMLSDAQVCFLLTQSHLLEEFQQAKLTISQFVVLDDDEAYKNQEVNNLPLRNLVTDLAYVIYTSGTTGKPKGVMIEHHSVVSLVKEAGYIEINSNDTLIQFSNPMFDAATFEIWGALLNGAKLILPGNGLDVLSDIKKFKEIIVNNKISILWLTKTLFDNIFQLDPLIFGTLKYLIIGGEALNAKLVSALCEQVNKPEIVLNGYGPTEGTTFTTIYRCTNKQYSSIPIGRPINNRKIYILDENRCPVPIGVTGELYISGAGLSRGYLNQDKLTNEKFLLNPFKDKTKKYSRLYKTGDLVRWLPDGNIEFLGRADQQVKIRGFRIECSEIEMVLSRHKLVKEAVVIVQENEQDKQLVAYLLGHDEIDMSELKNDIKSQLPDYMIPSYFVQLESFPFTSNGKLDRKTLSISQINREKFHENYVPPRDEIEKTLAQIWQKLLNVELVGVHDNFFKLGGHSLLAVRLVGLIQQQLTCNINVRELLHHPTIDQLRKLIKQDAEIELPTLVMDNVNRYEPFPLTAVQQIYWLGRQGTFILGDVSVHIYTELNFSSLDVPRLEASLNTLIVRHEMLRTVIDGVGQQRILPSVPWYTIKQQHLVTRNDRKQSNESEMIPNEVLKWREELSHQVLDSTCWPLFEFRVSKWDEKACLHLSVDALLFDALSMQIFFKEWETLYNNPHAELVPITLSFRDYVLAYEALKKTKQYSQHKAYWDTRLATLPFGPELPLVKRPQEISPLRFSRCSRTISAANWLALQQQAINNQVTPTSVLLTLFAAVLKCWSKHPNFLINLTLFNRLPLHEEVEDILGDFTSLELLEIKGAQWPTSFGECVQQVHEQLWEDLSHRLIDGVDVQRELIHLYGQNAMGIIAPVVFTSILNQAARKSFFAFDEASVGYSITQTPQVWLDSQVFLNNGELIVIWDYVEALFPTGMIAQLHTCFCDLIEQIIHQSWHKPLPPLLPENDKIFLAGINDTEREYTLTKLYEEFFVQSQLQPEAIAIISSNPQQQLTYVQLARIVCRIQHGLLAHAIQNNQLIAIVMETGWEQIAACLGILSAGAAYVPISAAWPESRIKEVLIQSEAKIVLSQSRVIARLEIKDELENYEWLAVDDKTIWQNYPDVRSEILVDLDDIAYVIFTSGSTGKPKGVVISHRNAMNTILAVNERFKINRADRIFALSDLSFDLSVYDIFGGLSVGACVVLPDAGREREPSHWLEMLERYQITVWNSVPLLLQVFVEYLQGFLDKTKQIHIPLRVILLSGDWLPLQLPEQIKRLWPNSVVMSLGGATEGSIWSIWYEIAAIEAHWKSIPYGKPLPNQHMYVLDQELNQRPIYVTGDIYIGGRGVAQGYWRNEEKTKENFIIHPMTGERLYKTGDKGRWLPDGNIEFLGREDNQVKIGGYRVELDEIASVLRELPEVKELIVEAIGEAGEKKQLVAYWVAIESISKAKKYWLEQLENYHFELNLPLKCKESFKLEQHGILKTSAEYYKLNVNLNAELYQLRKSYRNYLNHEIDINHISQFLNTFINNIHTNSIKITQNTIDKEILTTLLSTLSAIQLEDRVLPKYRYPSAGSSYAVRCFLSLSKPFNSIDLGYYYYHPIRHTLCKNKENKQTEFNELHLIIHWPAIKPLYKNQFKEFAYLEIGHMLSLLIDELDKANIHYQLEVLEKKLDDENTLAVKLIFNYTRLIPPSENLIYQALKNIQVNYLQKQNQHFINVNGDQCLDLSEFDIFSKATELGQLLDNGKLLVVIEGEKSIENLIASGFLFQKVTNTLCEQDIGSCMLGFAPYEGALYSMILGKIEKKQKNESNSNIQQTTMKVEQTMIDYFKEYAYAQLPAYMVPEYFVKLDSFPLTPNGKLNKKDLPTPKDMKKCLMNNYAAPRNIIEIKLIQIWEEVLSITPVSVEDNFFELGGHSLLGVRLMAKIQEIFQVQLSLHTIFQAPTIEKLSMFLMSQQKNMDWTPLVPMRSTGRNTPIFCIHPGGGSVFSYSDLAQSLGLEQPFYALQAKGFEVGQEPQQSIEEMADCYLTAIRKCQSQGPYYLAGWSMGGLVAYEIAQRLLSEYKEDVGHIWMIETVTPTVIDAVNTRIDGVIVVALFLAERIGRALGQPPYEYIKILVDKLLTLPLDEQFIYVLQEGKMAGIFTLDYTIEQLKRWEKLFHTTFYASKLYKAKSYPRAITLFRAEKEAVGYHDPTLGWEELVLGGVDVRWLSANHDTMILKPHVNLISQSMLHHTSLISLSV